jgi:Periplasmic binding protein-like domain
MAALSRRRLKQAFPWWSSTGSQDTIPLTPCSSTTGLARERLAGFAASLHAHGLESEPGQIRAGDFRQESGRMAIAELLNLGEDRLDVVFVAGDLMTLGALEAINEFGLRIPADLSVVGASTTCRGRRRSIRPSPQLRSSRRGWVKRRHNCCSTVSEGTWRPSLGTSRCSGG